MKKCIAVLLATLMMLTGLLQVSAADLLFINAEDEHYYDILTKLGVFSLYQDEEGFFDGAKEVSRGEAAMAIANLININIATDSDIRPVFSDVIPNTKAAGSIAAMVDIKAMTGFGDDLFRPHETIQTVHFIKALLVALGYQWKAEYAGGYPAGYLKIANEVELLKGIAMQDGQSLSRSIMLRILYNALDVQVYDVASVTPDSTLYQTSKDTTVLTKYHDIYEETAVVNSNAMTSLNSSFTANDKSVLIGNERVFLDGDTGIWSFFGQTITYFYRQETDSDKKVLVSFAAENNEVATLTQSQVERIDNNVVEYFDTETGRTNKIRYNTTTDVIYNNKREAISVKTVLENLSGTASFIDNDTDGEIDVIIIDDFVYDIVESLDLNREKIYCSGMAISLDSADAWVIEDESGTAKMLEELQTGDALAISKSSDGKLIRIVVLSTMVTGKVTQESFDSIKIDETTYKVSHGCPSECLASVDLGGVYCFVLNKANEIVYVKKGTVGELQFGYLIEAGEDRGIFDNKVYLRILTASAITVYEIREKIQLNGVLVKREDVIQALENLKENLALCSDGKISQVIRFGVDSNNVIHTIYTARLEENDYLTLKFNSEGRLSFLREAYSMGNFDGKYFVGDSTTFFQVPQTNQESLDDDYYFPFKFKKGMKDGNSYIVETYTVGGELIPSVAIKYSTESEAIDAKASLFMVDSIERALNSNGDQVIRYSGYVGGERTSYESKDLTNALELERGDVVVFLLSGTNEVKKCEKVYDASEDAFGEGYESTDWTETRSIMMFSTYKRVGTCIEASSVGFDNMHAAFDNLYALNFHMMPSIPMYDREKDEIRVVSVDSIVDYLHDSVGYTKILARHQSSYLMDAFMYQ